MSATFLLDKLAAYVPTPIAQAIFEQPDIPSQPTGHRFLAAVLFADISGFTALGELFSQAGATGAEELTQLINKHYTGIIETIETYHGQVVKFSGDALTVIFSADTIDLPTAIHRAGTCALHIQADLDDLDHIQTSQGTTPPLSMKISIGAGSILACIVGGKLARWEYVVAGDPLVQVATAQNRAQPRQVIFSPQAWQQSRGYFKGRTDNQEFVVIERAEQVLPKLTPMHLPWEELSPEQQQRAEAALKCYVPGAIKARLANQSDWLAELRRITVLFVGLGGLDYESDDAKDKLQVLVQAVQEITYDLEGALNKVAIDDKGTVLLILFGAPPFSHEDDAQRAVTCALRLQTIAQEQNLRMSIGITEGSIFAGPVGAPSRQEYTVIGDQANLSSRLMQQGRNGSIIISEAVKTRIQAKFTVEDLGPISVKGKKSTLKVYQVRGEEGAQLQFLTRYFSKENPLIGRKAELEQIRRMASRTRSRTPQILLIEGELGLGKSRLAAEMVREWMMENGAAYGSTCSSYSYQIPYHSWQRILSAIYGLTPDLTPERQLARLASEVARLADPPDQPGYWAERLPLLKEVMGLDIPDNAFTRSISGELRRDNIFILIETMLRHQAKSQPLLILLEDIHWADELSLSLADHLAQRLQEIPLFLVLAYRPLTNNSDLLANLKSHPQARTIHLTPLSAEESLTMVNSILGDKVLSEETQALIFNRGQGNPFFLQEIATAILHYHERQPKSEIKLAETLDLPGTIQDAIITRVDRLPDQERLTLKVAAVIGAQFERSLLSKVHPVDTIPNHLSGQLDDLENQKLIQLEIPDPKWEYSFRNVITQEVVYEGLLLAQRRQLHADIGAVLEQVVPDEIEQLAYHYCRSTNFEKGMYYLKQAAQKARHEYANQTAIGYFSEILTLMSTSPTTHSPNQVGDTNGHDPKRQSRLFSPDYWDILLERVQLYNLVGQRDEEAEDLGTLGILAEALNDDWRRALSAKQWAHLYESMSDYASGLEMIERSVQLAQQTEDKLLISEAYALWGKLLYLSGDYDFAGEILQKASDFAQKQGDQQVQADCYHNEGQINYYRADYEIALIYFQQAVSIWEARDDLVSLGGGLRDLGRVYYKLGEHIAAQASYQQALTLHRKIGDRIGEALTQHYSGQVARSLGNYGLAETLLASALSIHQQTGDRRGEADVLTQLGFLNGRRKNYEIALTQLETALEIVRELNDPWALSNVLLYYGWILTDINSLPLAQLALQEVLQIERDVKPGSAEGRTMEAVALMGRVALLRNDLSLADTCVRHTLPFLKRQGIFGIEHPARVYLTVYEILQARNKSADAATILQQGLDYITQQAAKIDDMSLRQAYLAIEEHDQLRTQAIR